MTHDELVIHVQLLEERSDIRMHWVATSPIAMTVASIECGVPTRARSFNTQRRGDGTRPEETCSFARPLAVLLWGLEHP